MGCGAAHETRLRPCRKTKQLSAKLIETSGTVFSRQSGYRFLYSALCFLADWRVMSFPVGYALASGLMPSPSSSRSWFSSVLT